MEYLGRFHVKGCLIKPKTTWSTCWIMSTLQFVVALRRQLRRSEPGHISPLQHDSDPFWKPGTLLVSHAQGVAHSAVEVSMLHGLISARFRIRQRQQNASQAWFLQVVTAQPLAGQHVTSTGCRPFADRNGAPRQNPQLLLGGSPVSTISSCNQSSIGGG